MNTVSKTTEVNVDGRRRRVAAQCTLADLIDDLGHTPQSIATAVNGEFVSREARAARGLREGDEVTCFQAIVGG